MECREEGEQDSLLLLLRLPDYISFSLFFFVRCPRSLRHYATLISSYNNNNNNNNNLLRIVVRNIG